jgi:signal peptidase II
MTSAGKKGSVPFSESGLRWLWLSVLVIALDQATKLWVSARLELFERVELLPFLNLVLVYNPGAAFSFLSDASGWQRWFFTALALVVSIVILVWLSRLRVEERAPAIGLALVLGGALGNVWDRLQHGHVIDFIDVYYRDWHWPAFNVADSAITIGVVFLIYDALIGHRRTQGA